MTLSLDQHRATASFHHEAFLYADGDAFLAGMLPFVRGGLALDEPVLVALPPANRTLLEGALGADAQDVAFLDMAVVGRNPARIIPVWQEFVASHPGRAVRGIGEPIWPGRSAAELIECQRHEALLNHAFADAPSWSLICPYDVARLDSDVIEAAREAHPHVHERGASRASDSYARPAGPFAAPLPPPAGEVAELRFSRGDLGAVRALVGERAERAGAGRARARDLTLAISELAANSILHGGGRGRLRIWCQDRHLVCEVRDRGRIDDPLAGRHRPAVDDPGGRGLWMVNQLCDLVQIRTLPDGSVVRAWLALTV